MIARRYTYKAPAVVNACLAAIVTELNASGGFTLAGFGAFTVRERKARTGRNPRSGAPIKMQASRTVTFRPSPALREALGPVPPKPKAASGAQTKAAATKSAGPAKAQPASQPAKSAKPASPPAKSAKAEPQRRRTKAGAFAPATPG